MSKVLLVEDDNNLREIYEARLAAEGYDIITAQNGEEALVVAKQNHPDLIISDVMMPRISGFEMLDILRNTDELRATKVIMLTALGQAEDQARAGKLGADKYLVKSQVTLEDIVNSAKELLGELTSTPAPAAPAAPTQEVVATQVATAPDETPAIAEPVAPAPAAAPAPQPEPVPAPAPIPDSVSTTDTNTAPQVTPAPVDPTPTVSTASVPVADPDPIVAPTPDDTTTAQTTAAEEATVTNQIADFASTASGTDAPTPTVPPVSISAANDAVLTQAVNDLTQATTAPDVAAVAPSKKQESAPVTPSDTSGDTQTVAGKKIIQPINDITNPAQDIDALLAKEAAKEQAAVATEPTTSIAPTTIAPAPATNTGFDPNSIAL